MSNEPSLITAAVSSSVVLDSMDLEPTELIIGNPPLVKINLSDGTLTYGRGYEPTEAAHQFWDAIRILAGLQKGEAERPSEDHHAVYLDQDDQLWADYPTSPPSDFVLPLVWASEQARSREGLAGDGIELRRIGWHK